MSCILGIQLHISALYIGHCQVVLKLIKQQYDMCGAPWEYKAMSGMSLDFMDKFSSNSHLVYKLKHDN